MCQALGTPLCAGGKVMGRQVSVWSSGIRVLLRPAEALPWGRAPGSVFVTAAQDLDSRIGTQVSVGSQVVVGGGGVLSGSSVRGEVG